MIWIFKGNLVWVEGRRRGGGECGARGGVASILSGLCPLSQCEVEEEPIESR